MQALDVGTWVVGCPVGFDRRAVTVGSIRWFVVSTGCFYSNSLSVPTRRNYSNRTS